MLQTPVHQRCLNYQQLLSSTLPPLDSPINDLLILIAIANVIQTQLIQIKDKIREMKKQCGWLEFQIIVLLNYSCREEMVAGDDFWFMFKVDERLEHTGSHHILFVWLCYEWWEYPLYQCEPSLVSGAVFSSSWSLPSLTTTFILEMMNIYRKLRN